MMRIRPFSGLLIALVLQALCSMTLVHAALEGMWRTTHPELGGLFFRIKSDGTSTYFVEKGVQTPIIHGTWTEIPTGLELKFDDGAVFSVGELEPGLTDVRMTLAPGQPVAPGMIVSKGELIVADTIGRMTVDPKNENEDDNRLGYFGAWEGETLDGKKFYILINEDRTAGKTHSFSKTSEDSEYPQVIGFWRKDGEKLQVYWNDGSYTSIETNGRRIEQTTFVAGSLLEEAKGYTCRILPVRVKDLPEAWHERFRADFVARMPIIVLRQLSQIKSFFRGNWIVAGSSEGEPPQVIRLKRFGRASTNRFGGVRGDWYPGSDTATIIWRNGIREQVANVGNQFVVNTFVSSQPSTARPSRIELINPENTDKLGYYINRKRELLDPSRFFRALQGR
jgi:hypothetical protein